MKGLIACVLLLSALLAHAAAEVAGIRFADTATVAGKTLVLNGAGLRKKLFFKVYAVGLYLPAKAGGAAEAIAETGPKRLDLTLLRDLSAQTFVDAFVEGLSHNLSPDELRALDPQIEQFTQSILALEKAPEGARFQIDYAPASGTQLSVNGNLAGAAIPGPELYNAILRVWLGEMPAQEDLKAGLLGR